MKTTLSTAAESGIREAVVEITWPNKSSMLFWDNGAVFLFAGNIKNSNGFVEPAQMNGWTELGTTETSSFTYYGFKAANNASIGGNLNVVGNISGTSLRFQMEPP
jgi:hypothetical protein